jgi:hypothetical protein
MTPHPSMAGQVPASPACTDRCETGKARLLRRRLKSILVRAIPGTEAGAFRAEDALADIAELDLDGGSNCVRGGKTPFLLLAIRLSSWKLKRLPTS